MAVVKLLNGEEVADRRKNGARLRLVVNDWIKLIGIAIAAIVGYSTLVGTVSANSRDVKDHKAIIGDLVIKSALYEDNIKDIKLDISEIKKDIRAIAGKYEPIPR